MFGDNKIRVVTIGGYVPKRKNCKVRGDQVILEDKGKGSKEITATYDNTCLIPYFSGLPPFRTVKHYLMIKEGSSKCISFAADQPEVPSVTKKEVRAFTEASVINRAGNPKAENKTMIYLLLGVVIVLNFITLLAATGNIRF